MMLSKSTMIKIAVGVVAVLLIFCVLTMSKSKAKNIVTSMPLITTMPMQSDKFAAWEPEDDDEEDYADYVPSDGQEEQMYVDSPIAEQYVDAADVYATPNASGQLLDQ